MGSPLPFSALRALDGLREHMRHIDIQYINLIGTKIDKFHKVRDNLWCGRCPICGDSKKDKTKTRFYIYQIKTDYAVKCHNCAYSTSFGKFLKELVRCLDHTVVDILLQLQAF